MMRVLEKKYGAFNARAERCPTSAEMGLQGGVR